MGSIPVAGARKTACFDTSFFAEFYFCEWVSLSDIYEQSIELDFCILRIKTVLFRAFFRILFCAK